MVELIEFRPNMWLTELDLPDEDFSVRGAVIRTENHIVIWDTLSHPRDMQPVLPLIGDRKVTIIYSHADWDHCWGTAAFKDYTPTIIGKLQCRWRFEDKDDVPKQLADKLAKNVYWQDVELAPPNITFTTFSDLYFDDLKIRLGWLLGHTTDCIVAEINQWGILLAGDTVETPVPVVNVSDRVPTWIDQLELFAERTYIETVIPSHGRIGGRELLTYNANYLRSLQTGETFADLPDDLDDFYKETHAKNQRLVRGG